VEQEGATEAVEQERKLRRDRLMIGPVRLSDPFVELAPADRAAPEIAVLLRPRRHDAETAAGAGGHQTTPSAVDNRRIDFVFGAIAVDCRAGGAGDYRAAASLHRAPHQPVDQ